MGKSQPVTVPVAGSLTLPPRGDLYDVLVPGTSRSIYLHVGPPKTGTTYLQDTLWRNRRRLGAVGVDVPGSHRLDHFYAALDLRGVAFNGYVNPATAGAWAGLAKQVRKGRAERTVISHEVLAGADVDEIARVAADFAGFELHVVYGARDLARQLPAVWQESLKNRRTKTYDRYLRRALRDGGAGTPEKGFWRAQDAVAALANWSTAVPRERIHVVTLPPTGSPPTLLWRRFCQVLGISADRFELSAGTANPSLNAVDAEVLRRLNKQLPPELPWPTYERIVKARFTRRAELHKPGERLRVPPEHRASVLAISERTRAGLRSAGYDIVGDLDDLIPADSGFGPVPSPSPDTVASAAVDMLATALTEAHRTRWVAPREAVGAIRAYVRARGNR